MDNTEVRYDLTGPGIDEAGEAAYEFLTAAKVERKDALRVRLALEEALLRYRDEGTAGEFTLRCRWRFRAPRVELSLTGPSLDPLAEQDGPDSGALTGMMAQMGLAPLWHYKDGTNRVLFTPKRKKRSLMVSLAIALVLAAVLGYLCRLLPEAVRLVLTDKLVTPVFNTFMGLLTAISGPMIFLSVTWGICCMGDVASFGRIGKRMITKLILFTVVLGVIAGAAVVPFFPMAAGGGQTFDPSELMDMVLDIVPANFFTPFTEGNPLQIIFVAVLIGIALLLLGEKVSVAATFVEQSNYVVQLIMEAISSLVPVFVFGSVFKMFLGDGFRLLAQSYKLIPVIVLGTAVMMACSLALVCVRWKVGPVTVLKKTMPTFLIGLSTASSVAAFPTNQECCEKQLGIHEKLSRFGIPLGQVIYMPGAVVLFLVASMSMAEIYGVAITPAWLLTALFICVMLAIACPPVPGSALTCYTLLFTQLGIPMEAVAVMTALNVILEFIATSSDLFCLQMALTDLGGSLDMLDMDTLRSAASTKKKR